MNHTTNGQGTNTRSVLRKGYVPGAGKEKQIMDLRLAEYVGRKMQKQGE